MKPNIVLQLDEMLLRHRNVKRQHPNFDYVKDDSALKNEELVDFVNAFWNLRCIYQVGPLSSFEDKRSFLKTMHEFVETNLGSDSVLARDIEVELNHLDSDGLYDSFFYDDVLFLEAAFALGK